MHWPRFLPHVEGVIVLSRGRVVQGGVVEVSAEVVLEDAGVLLEGVAVQVGVLREVRRRLRTAQAEIRVSFREHETHTSLKWQSAYLGWNGLPSDAMASPNSSGERSPASNAPDTAPVTSIACEMFMKKLNIPEGVNMVVLDGRERNAPSQLCLRRG